MNKISRFAAQAPLFLFYGLTIFAVGLRLFLYPRQVIPTNSNVVFEASVPADVKSTDTGQKIHVQNVTILAPLYPAYHAGERVRVSGFINASGLMLRPKIEVISKGSNFGASIRDKLTSGLTRLLPAREASLVAGATIGADIMPTDFKDELTRTGTIHIVVVSGQNLIIVIALMASLTKFLGRRISTIVSLVVASLYAVFTGFEVPVVRALIMVSFSSVALFTGRISSAIMALFASGAIILIIWPDSISSISFQLTFAATFGIMTLGQLLTKKLSKLPVLGENMAVSLSAFVFTAPVILFYFGRLSLLSPLVNLIVAELVTPLMILGFVLSLAILILGPLAWIFGALAYVPAKLFSVVVSEFAKINVGYFEFKSPVLPVIVYYLVVLILIYIWKSQRVPR